MTGDDLSPSRSYAPVWLRASSEWAARLLVVVVGIAALGYVLGYLRIVVLPIILALLASTLLLPPKRALMRRGVPNAAAVSLSMLGAVLLLAGIGTAIAPSIGSQADELGSGVQDGVRSATRVLADEPFNLSRADINERVNEGWRPCARTAARSRMASARAPCCSAKG